MSKTTQWTILALLGFAIIGGSGCSFARAQDRAPDSDKDRRTISVSGMGSIRVDPDLALAVLGVSKSSPKLSDAKSAADSAINQVKGALQKAGVAEQDVKTVQYQIYHVQANPQAGIRESNWRVVHMLQIRTKKPDSIASIVDSAVSAGATDVRSVAFSVDDWAPHRARARELAVNAAVEKARHLASLLKVNVGEVISVSEVGDFQPMAEMANMRMDAGEGFGGGSGIMGGQIEVTTNTQVVFAIR